MTRGATHAIGVDIGGTGIKAGIVDLEEGKLSSDRIRVSTPEGAEPEDVLGAVREVLDTLGVSDSDMALGVAFPAIVKGGRTLSAANVSKRWIDFEAEKFFEDGLGRDIHFVNDADAAGIAEVRHGAAKGQDGLTILTTLGTGIGSAMIYDGVLIPNSELGHVQRAKHGGDAETFAAYSAMEREALSWKDWTERLQWYYSLHRVPVHARPLRRRRRSVEAPGEVPAAAEAADADRARGAPQLVGHHRGREPGRRRTSRGDRGELIRGAVSTGRPGGANGPACTPGSVRGREAPWTAIYLGDTLPCRSSGLPGDSASRVNVPCLTLLRARFTQRARHRAPGGLLHHRFTLTRAARPAAVCSLWHCLADHSGWVLPTALPCGARTFLGACGEPRATRPSSRPIRASSYRRRRRRCLSPSRPSRRCAGRGGNRSGSRRRAGESGCRGITHRAGRGIRQLERHVQDDLVVQEERQMRPAGERGARARRGGRLADLAERVEAAADLGHPRERPLGRGALHDEVAGEPPAVARALAGAALVGGQRRVVAGTGLGIAPPRRRRRRAAPEPRRDDAALLPRARRLIHQRHRAREDRAEAGTSRPLLPVVAPYIAPSMATLASARSRRRRARRCRRRGRAPAPHRPSPCRPPCPPAPAAQAARRPRRSASSRGRRAPRRAAGGAAAALRPRRTPSGR